MLSNRQLRDEQWSEDGTSVSYTEPANLKVTTNEAVRVQLADLGYELHLDLRTFRLDYQSKQMSYLATNYFKPVGGASAKEQRRFERNRKTVYYGSSLHFMRSLIADSLAENGFQVVEVLQEPSLTRDQQVRTVNLRRHLRKNKDGNYLLMGLSENKYAILYHGDAEFGFGKPDLRYSGDIH